jgi:PleD family two-component response regulator
MHNKKRMLIIDDDEMRLNIVKQLLYDERIEVITHHSSFGATYLVSELQPDLVLLNINMPIFSREHIAQPLRLEPDTRKIPIVFFSSNDEDRLRELAKTHGVRGYIRKGNIPELRNKVNKYLRLQAEEIV